MRFIKTLILAALMLILAACSSASSQGDVSAGEQVYIQNKGSDTMVNIALAWAEFYQANHPEVRISVSGGGSGTGIAALLSKTVDIANASRAIKQDEIDQAEEIGVTPVEFAVARDAIAVIVNPHNPVGKLSLQQISDIYTGKINNWAELGGEDRPIVRLSRETNSGTHVYFLEEVIRLGNKDDKTIFSANTLLLPSSEGIIAEVQDNPNAIGYDGLGYITPEVKMVAVQDKDGGEYVLPSIASVNDGSYAISRDLYMYTSGEPQGVLRAYLDWILTAEAQKIVQDLGFVPVLVEGASQ